MLRYTTASPDSRFAMNLSSAEFAIAAIALYHLAACELKAIIEQSLPNGVAVVVWTERQGDVN